MLKMVVSRQSSVVSIILFLLLTTYNLRLTTCFAQAISSAELIDHAAQYDGKVVTYEGEVVGEAMVRKGNAWVNLNDGVNAIGIWADKDLVKDIIYTGNYKSKGDWLEVAGTFNRACSVHGGDLDIHAQLLRKISNGRLLTERLNPGKRMIVLILGAGLCLLLILQLFRKLLKRK